MPEVWRRVLLPLVRGIGAKKVRGDVDHGGSVGGSGSGGFTARSVWRSSGRLSRDDDEKSWGVQWSR